jgi:hypothetical protein
VTRAGDRALVALTLLGALSNLAAAQDTTAVIRHLLSLDISKVQPYRRTYDMIVHARDSAIVIGQREVLLSEASYAGSPAWLLVETRTGLVPASESLFVAPDLRPLHWSSVLGTARLGAEFVGDSIYGASTMSAGKQNVVILGRPDLLVSGPMVELLVPLLPLWSSWADSVGVLGVDLVTNQVTPAELAVIGEEDVALDSSTVRHSWVVALRSGARHVLFWIDKDSGAALRVQQMLPPHAGGELEYRLRPESPTAPPPR